MNWSILTGRKAPDLHTRSDEDQRLIDGLKSDVADGNREIAQTGVLLTAARATLTKIVAMETASCAPIGKRMAAAARVGLGGEGA